MQPKEQTTTKEVTAKRKWLNRIGHFMIMGGFFVVIIVALGIAIGVSLLTKGC